MIVAQQVMCLVGLVSSFGCRIDLDLAFVVNIGVPGFAVVGVGVVVVDWQQVDSGSWALSYCCHLHACNLCLYSCAHWIGVDKNNYACKHTVTLDLSLAGVIGFEQFLAAEADD